MKPLTLSLYTCGLAILVTQSMALANSVGQQPQASIPAQAISSNVSKPAPQVSTQSFTGQPASSQNTQIPSAIFNANTGYNGVPENAAQSGGTGEESGAPAQSISNDDN